MNRKFKLLNKLARKSNTFRFEDARRMSDLSNQSLKLLLHRMEKEGLVERIEKGKYLIIPLGAEKGRYTINEFVIGSQLVKPAVIAYWSALNYHGFTEQVPNTVFIQTTSRKKKRELEIFGVKYKIVRLIEKKFFGFEKIWIGDAEVEITDIEKTVVDCFDKPQYCGGIVEASKALRSDLNLSKVMEYAKKMGNSAIIKRLGFLCERMGIKIEIQPDYISKGYPLLDPSMHGRGSVNRKWRILENLDEKMLDALE